MGSVLFRRCPPPGPAQPAAGADFYLMVEYMGRGDNTAEQGCVMCHCDQQLSILCFEINGWVCLPLVVVPTVSSGQLSQCRGYWEIFTFSSSSWRGVGPKHAPAGAGARVQMC